MKTIGFFIALLAPLVSFCQWQNDTGSVIYTAKPDSIFWVDDIIQFTDEDDLFTWDRYISDDTHNIILLGNYERFAYGFVNTKAYLAIKDGKRFRLWDFSPFVGEFTTIKFGDFVSLNKKNLLCVLGSFFTSWSLMNPYAGSFNSEYETLILFDTSKNEVVFSKTFSYYEDRVKDDDKLERYRNEEGFELDSNDYEYQWFNYRYIFKKDKIEFYKIDEKPTTYLEQEEVTGKKPTFYFTYKGKNKKWVKKIPTH